MALDEVDGDAATALSRLMYWPMSNDAMMGEGDRGEDSTLKGDIVGNGEEDQYVNLSVSRRDLALGG